MANMESRSIIRAAGSLWFAAVLLILLLVAMACATVFESTHGTEQALGLFYTSWWFKLLLALLAVNVFAALVLRWPFSKKQIGFVVTHTSILVILAGAYVTKNFAIQGQVGIAEGQTVENFYNDRQDCLTILNHTTGAQSTVDLSASVFGRFVKVDHPKTPPLSLGNVQVSVDRYLPNSITVKDIVNESADINPAIEVSLTGSGLDDQAWILADHHRQVGPVPVAFKLIATDQQLERLIAAPAASQPTSTGSIKIEYQGSTFELAVEDCMDKAVPLGQSGWTVRVLRYLPHATVSADQTITSASDRPVNPAVEVELVGPSGSEKRLAFARFPDFLSTHNKEPVIPELKLIFVSGQIDESPTAPVEVLSGPAGQMYVRFGHGDQETVTRKLTIGTPVQTAWEGLEFTVLQRFDHAMLRESIVPAEVIGTDRIPALLVKLSTGQETGSQWVQKNQSAMVTLDGTEYHLDYGQKVIPLGFALKLDRFAVGYYPGLNKPRSFQSNITVVDPATGRQQSRVISMNNPTKQKGYSLYQSSYRQDEKRTISYLSVSWDPGQPIVFVGYIGLLVGMLLVVATRVMLQRASSTEPVVLNQAT